MSLTVVPRKKVGTQGLEKPQVKVSIHTSAHNTYITVPRKHVVAPPSPSHRTAKAAGRLSEANRPAVLTHVLNCSTNQDSVTRGESAKPATLARENTSQTLTVREKKNTLMQTCLILKQNHIAHIEQQCIKSCDIFR